MDNGPEYFRVVGCSHLVANLETREKMAFTESQVRASLDRFDEQFPFSDAVLIATCNRTELYATAHSPKQIPSRTELIDFLASECKLDRSEIESACYSYDDLDAIKHLFNVAASLDSMVVGEPQILSQVKRSYQLAVESHQPHPLTHQVFQSAIRVARRVKRETQIHDFRVSIASVAIGGLARRNLDRLENKNVLILGAGKMARETLNYLLSVRGKQPAGGKQIVITNRTYSKAVSLADHCKGCVGDWGNLVEHLANADLVISTTAAPGQVVTKAMFDAAHQLGSARPVVILDLAMPRDFSVDIGDLPNVELVTLDDLQRECEQNRKSRLNEFPIAQKIIDDESIHFQEDMRNRSNGSTISQLIRQTNGTKSTEFERLMNRLESLDAKQRNEIEQSFDRLVNKILHPPLKALRDDESGKLVGALKKLFRLDE